MLKRSNITYREDALFIKSNLERIDVSLKWLDDAFKRNYFNSWDYLSMSLYSLLVWANFRDLIKLSDFGHFDNFIANYAQEQIILDTAPFL
jgi:glutathione S-transferase